MNLTPRTLKIIGFIILGVSLVFFGFIIAYNWRNKNGLPDWLIFIPISLSLIANYTTRKAKKMEDADNKK
jgi:hypothetical protein